MFVLLGLRFDFVLLCCVMVCGFGVLCCPLGSLVVCLLVLLFLLLLMLLHGGLCG